MPAMQLSSRISGSSTISGTKSQCRRRTHGSCARPSRQLPRLQASESPEQQTTVQDDKPLPSTVPPPPAATPETSTSPNGGGGGNRAAAAGAVAAAVLLFAGGRFLASPTAPTLTSLEAASVPLERALANGKPTVVEFYADWCEVCRELVNDEAEVESQYRDKVNFVMLNVENSRWAPELAEYGVAGIPHFVFLDGQARQLAATVGRVPRPVLEGNVAALAEQRELPYSRARGRTSGLAPANAMMGPPPRADVAPRAHS